MLFSTYRQGGQLCQYRRCPPSRRVHTQHRPFNSLLRRCLRCKNQIRSIRAERRRRNYPSRAYRSWRKLALHPFQMPEPTGFEDGSVRMGKRGHIDHLALKVDDEEELAGSQATSGEGRRFRWDRYRFRRHRLVTFKDPDGMEGEVARWTDSKRVLGFEERKRELSRSELPASIPLTADARNPDRIAVHGADRPGRRYGRRKWQRRWGCDGR